MTLHMLKLEPDMGRLIRWAKGRDLLPQSGDDDLGYILHALLLAAFGEFAPKPFVLQQQPRRPALLAYFGHDPAVLREHADTFADPDVVEALGIPGMAVKPMPAHFSPGRRLGFSVRVRPTVRTDLNGDRDRVREVDAFKAALDRAQPGDEPERGAVYRHWLSGHLIASGATAERLSLESFRLSDTQRRRSDRTLQRLRRGPDVLFSGVLRVADPDAFAALLARGVGRHRAFGYGMLLLRPA